MADLRYDRAVENGVVDTMLVLIAEGLSVSQAVKALGKDGMHRASWFRWLGRNPDNLQERYGVAKATGMDSRIDEIVDISDNKYGDEELSAKRADVMIRARLSMAEKLAPLKYGKRQQIEHAGGMGITYISAIPEPDLLPDSMDFIEDDEKTAQ